jgi:hypothetical protein
MLKATKRIIITSERVNNYGFRVLTDGIDLSQFNKNKLMLWMHKRPFGDAKEQILALGNVIDLQLEDHPELGRVITGLPVFDEDDKFAMRIYKKYENGIYCMASAGLRPVEWSDAPEHLVAGQRGPTLIKSQLEEVSLCDLGGNDDALTVALYDTEGAQIQLSLNGDNAAIPALKNKLIENEMNKIELTAGKLAQMLGKTEITSADQAETEILSVVQLAQRQKTQIETLTRESGEKDAKITELENKGLTEDTNVMLSKAVADRVIVQEDVAFYEDQITDRAGFEKVKIHLEKKTGAPSVKDVLHLSGGAQTGAYAGKTYDELDKAGKLVQLKADDLNLFKSLFKTKFGTEYGG